ncbi:hypothetical protein [Sorangium sp. So ce385]|uniref:hypothetical protein n=1 Tax=Sorangium sp. So ce385 TaxID=3133308 RepID=UPI003F5C4987
MTNPDAPPPAEPALRGLSLARLAGVHAGLSEGLPLGQVLANEGVDARLWERAEPLWVSKLAEDAELDGPLQDAYDERIRAARLRYGRSVRPLDADLRAWIAFLRVMEAQEDPMALLARVGLRPADLLRLHGVWSGKLSEDADLRARAESWLAAAPSALPEITVGPPVLTAPPAEGPLVEIAPPLEDDDDQDEDDDQDDDDDDQDEDDEGAAEEAPPLWVPLPGWPSEMRSPRPAPGVIARAPALSERRSPVPFSPMHAETRTVEPWPASSAGTSMPAAEPSLRAAGLTPAALAGESREPHPLSATEQRAPHERSELHGVAERRLDATLGMPAFVPEAALPFRPAGAPRALAPPEQRFDSTVQLTTRSLPAVPAGPVLPFRPPEEGTGAASPRAPTSAGPAHGAGSSAPPPPPLHRSAPAAETALSLAQYASLCAELAVFPRAAEAIFRRYGLESQQARAAVDAAWKERLGRDAGAYGAWQEMYRRYHAYWTQRGAPAT